MLGAIIGDIVGSIYEFDNIKTKEFPFFEDRMEYTDDSILTIATADWLLSGGYAGDYYLRYAKMYPYPMGSYGTMFVQWIHKANRGQMQPYNSCGNGSAMRIAPVGWAFEKEKDLLKAAKKSRKYEKWTKRMESEFANVKVSDISKESIDIGKKYV